MTLDLLEIRSRTAARRTRAATEAPAPALPDAPPEAAPGWFTPAALVSAIVALGCALQVNFGQYHPLALAWLSAALLACGAAVALPNFGSLRVRGMRPDLVLAGFGLALQFFILLTTNPAATIDPSRLLPFRAGLVFAGASAAIAIGAGGRGRTVGVVSMLFAHFLLGAWVLRETPHPRVDVFTFQEQACAALLRGENPYAITFADPNPATSDQFYAPGAAVNGRLRFGYPYPPLTLWMALPGHVLMGDFRWAQLVAMTLAGGLVALTGRGPMSVLAAGLLLFTPRGFFVLEAGWTEPFVVLLLALAVFVASRPGFTRGIALPVALGLLLVSKQYVVLAVPLLPLLRKQLAPASSCRGRVGEFDESTSPRILGVLCTRRAVENPGRRSVRSSLRSAPAWQGIGIALLVAALVTLPLVLWNVPAFVRSAVVLQFRQPFRPDALSFLVPFSTLTGHVAPAWISFALVLPTLLLCLCRRLRTPSGFASGFALTFLVFFAFNKQAFCNYYHLVLAGLCCALAGLPAPSPSGNRPQPY